HVLIAGFDLHAGGNRTTDGVEASLKLRGFVRRQPARLRQRAEQDLAEARDWYETQVPGLGGDVLDQPWVEA
ncbi:MAG: hypothetical protein ACO27L_04650, partial [Schleiferiaceae bacterium]